MVNAELRNQIQKLKIALENSELVQHDFVKLSQTLQVRLSIEIVWNKIYHTILSSLVL